MDLNLINLLVNTGFAGLFIYLLIETRKENRLDKDKAEQRETRASLKWRRKLSAMTVTVIKPASDIPTKRHKEIIDEPRRKSVNATASIIGEEKERQNKAIKPIAVKAIKEKKIQKPPEEPEQPKQLSEEEERDIHIQWLIDEVNELSDSEWDEVMSSRLYDKDGK